MEDIRELKNVLEKVEGKLIAAGKMYGAMNFTVWLVIMLLYYVLSGIFRFPWQFNIVYWPAAFILAMFFSGRIWKKFMKLAKVEVNKKSGRFIALSWIAGFIIGWFVIPLLINKPENTGIALALLSFISVSVGCMYLTAMRSEKEMIPSFAVPALLIPVVFSMDSEATVLAGFGVGLGFAFTVLLYLYSAFTAIER